jgi:hypothetical protein
MKRKRFMRGKHFLAGKYFLVMVSVFIIGGMMQEVFASITLPASPAKRSTLSESTASARAPYVQEAALRIPSHGPTPTPFPEGRKDVPFRVGEQLTYSVYWGMIHGGSVTIQVANILDFQGHPVYQILVTAQSNAVVSVFYSLFYELETLIDTQSLFSRRYWMKQVENGKHREQKYEFDQEHNVAIHKNNKNYYLVDGALDEISAVFYVRTLDLDVGTPVYLDLYANRQNWRVKCDVLATETVKVKAGTFETILVEPELNFDGLMKKGKMKAWFTNDAHRIPVQVKSKIVIGSITMELEDYRLGEFTENTPPVLWGNCCP